MELTVELDRGVWRAGEQVSGVVVLCLERPTRLRGVWVDVTGRELVGTPCRYLPAVYRYPVPRPWGRTRTGVVHIHLHETAPLLGSVPAEGQGAAPDAGIELAAGRHELPFRIAVPADALPSFRGATAAIEHEANAFAADQQGQLRSAWAPLHLWAGPAAADPERDDPVRLVAPSPEPPSLVDRLVAGLRPPVGLCVELPRGTWRLADELTARYTIDNPQNLALKSLVVEFRGLETSRHRAATDVLSFLVARRVVPVPAGRRVEGELVMPMPKRTAPNLLGRRFRLEWELHAELTLPWRLGVSASVPLRLIDPPPPAGQDRPQS